MPHRKLDIAARAAGFAMVNQDYFDSQPEFFVRLDKDGTEAVEPVGKNFQAERKRDETMPSWSWLSSFSLRSGAA